MTTLAKRLAETLKIGGVNRVFGIPGGGSSLDLMEAARRQGIDFVVTRTEAAATIMAAITGEMTGIPGVALVGVGPGASSATNGLAYASIERSPMFLFIDGPASSAHQHFDQQALYAPITRTTTHLRGDTAMQDFADAWRRVISPPEGPAMFEFTAANAATDIADLPSTSKPQQTKSADLHDGLKDCLSNARKPIAIIGLEARHHATEVRQLLDKFNIPAVLTYKALGVVSNSSPLFIGPVTGAVGENTFYAGADTIIGIGFDPIEFIPGTWPQDLPEFISLSEAEITNPRIPIKSQLVGNLPELLDQLTKVLHTSDWSGDEISSKRMNSQVIYQPQGSAFSCATAIEVIAGESPKSTRIACDAGAHMFATLGLWPADNSFDVLKSNGLSTMGYALPAAIAAKLCDPDKSTIAITGDGGMSMCLGELATAKELGLDITAIVMNDAALSLIDIKQQRQQRPPTGVRYPIIDYAAIAEAFGWESAVANNIDELRTAMRIAGPKLIDVRVDPAGYGEDLERLRG